MRLDEVLSANEAVCKRRRTPGGDRDYGVQEFHEELRERNVTPHIAARKDSRLDRRINDMDEQVRNPRAPESERGELAFVEESAAAR